MAAQAFKLYNRAIYKIGAGTIDLPGAVRIALFGSGVSASDPADFATRTLSLLGQVSDQVTSGNGYSSSGKTLASESWTAGTSAGQMKFDATDPVWTATGGAINSIKGCVLFMSGASAGACHVLAFASLTSSPFNLASGNTLTLQFNSSGIFTAANA
jgi:hypothetical protein